MRLNDWIVAVVAAVAIGLGGLAWAATPDEVVADRKATMKAMDEIGHAFDDAVSSEADVKAMAAQAAKLAELGHDIPAMFPPGTETANKTRAWPEVWTDRAKFEHLAGQFAVDSRKLTTVAAAGDKDGFASQWDTVGNECGGCHRSFKRH